MVQAAIVLRTRTVEGGGELLTKDLTPIIGLDRLIVCT